MNPPNDDFTAIAAQAEDLGNEAFGRVPSRGDFGMLVSGDASPAIGGGMQVFMWFESREAMLAFIEKYGFLIHPPHGSLDLAATQQFTRSMAHRIRLNEVSEAEAPDALTEGLRGSTKFHWLGKFESLCFEETPFGLELRRDFRDNSDGHPIEPEESVEFLEFLSLYGV